MDDFLLSYAKSNFDDYKTKWIVSASFDALPVTKSVRLQLPLDVNSTSLSAWSLPYWSAATSRLSARSTASQVTIIGHFTVESYHAIAVSLALVDLTKLNCLVPPGYHIQTINHPLPRQPETVVMEKVFLIIIIIIIITTGCGIIKQSPKKTGISRK